MAIQRMDNVAIVVDNLDAAVAFFTELGMELDGKGQVEGLGRTAPSAWTASAARSR